MQALTATPCATPDLTQIIFIMNCFHRNVYRGTVYVCHKLKLECAPIVQTSANAFNLNQKWSGIRNQISAVIRIRSRRYAASLPKWCGQGRRQKFSLEGPSHGERGARVYNPPDGEPLVGDQGSKAPPSLKLKAFQTLDVEKWQQIW